VQVEVNILAKRFEPGWSQKRLKTSDKNIIAAKDISDVVKASRT
jgi:hypothetical protein